MWLPTATVRSLPLVSRLGLLTGIIVYGTRGLFGLVDSLFPTNPARTPVIYTPDGPVQGRLGQSRNGQEYWQFLGIPYAQPPEGELRFQPPLPAQSWTEVRESIRFPPACAQFDPLATATVLGRENCLFLNVFTRESNFGSGVPVVVYFHGGVFAFGDNSFYQGTFLMDHPIVTVVVQYRLGPLGFLNLEDKDPRYPRGNMGLKDQRLALQWVQKSISAFGGDPSRVSIMGDSAGSSSVHFHMLSPSSEGLFSRGIAHSGSAFSNWIYSETPRRTAINYAQRLGCDTASSESIYQCMRNLDAVSLLRLQWSWNDPSLENDDFVATLEPVLTNDTFLTERPIETMRYGKYARVPVLAGMLSGDGTLRSARLHTYPEAIQNLARDWNGFISRFLFFEENLVSPQINPLLRNYYFGNTDIGSLSEKSALKIFTDLASDAMFYEPMHTFAVEHARNGAPIYMYFWNYRSRLLPGLYTFYRAARLSDFGGYGALRLVADVVRTWLREKIFGFEFIDFDTYGVAHTAQMFQIWNILGLGGPIVDGGDKEFSEAVVRFVVDFMYGRELQFRGVKWPVVNEEALAESRLPFMIIDENGYGHASPVEPLENRLRFWDSLAQFRNDRR